MHIIAPFKDAVLKIDLQPIQMDSLKRRLCSHQAKAFVPLSSRLLCTSMYSGKEAFLGKEGQYRHILENVQSFVQASKQINFKFYIDDNVQCEWDRKRSIIRSINLYV